MKSRKLTITETAIRFECSREWVRQLIKSDKLKAEMTEGPVKHYLIDEREVVKFEKERSKSNGN